MPRIGDERNLSGAGNTIERNSPLVYHYLSSGHSPEFCIDHSIAVSFFFIWALLEFFDQNDAEYYPAYHHQNKEHQR